jgi:hypothetical protein
MDNLRGSVNVLELGTQNSDEDERCLSLCETSAAPRDDLKKVQIQRLDRYEYLYYIFRPKMGYHIRDHFLNLPW